MNLGSIGVWSALLRVGDRAAMLKAAAELEELGYGTIWFPGREHAGLAEHIMALLGTTQRMVVATGIVNIWTHPAAEIAAEHHVITRAYPGRFLLGLGISHRPAVEGAGLTYERPLRKMIRYLDELDAAPTRVPIPQPIPPSPAPPSPNLAPHPPSRPH